MPHFPKPFYRKPRNCWYVQIAGKQVNLGPDKEAAFSRYYELMQSPTTVVVPVATTKCPTMPEIADAFLDWVKQERAPRTFEFYQTRLQEFCTRQPDLKIDDMKPFHVQQWVSSRTGLSQTSRRNLVRSVKTCMTWAMRQGYIEKNPIALMQVPAAEHREVTVSLDEFSQLQSVITNEAFRDLVTVTWETGCRPQESLRVEARHVDLERRRWVFPKAEAKGKRKPRIVYLTDTAMEITIRRMNAYPTGPLFRNSIGTPWTKDAVNCAFTRLRFLMGQEIKCHKMAKPTSDSSRPTQARSSAPVAKERREISLLAPRYSLYSLRHAWATRALESGIDGLTVAILMGHSDPSTLAKVYQHLSHNPEHMLAQARRATPPASA